MHNAAPVVLDINWEVSHYIDFQDLDKSFNLEVHHNYASGLPNHL